MKLADDMGGAGLGERDTEPGQPIVTVS